jgi:succinate dehydrogenase/fumarate reductase cytochrome b subunit
VFDGRDGLTWRSGFAGQQPERKVLMNWERFWERVWRSAGIQFVVLFIIASIVYGDQPKVGASAHTLVSFYDGDRTRILIATFIFGLALLNLLWFGAALRSVLHDAGQGGWGAAATASSAALASVLFVLTTVGAALAYSIAGSGKVLLTSGLNDVEWVGFVMVSFPAAMFVMSGAFGLWRAGIISNAVFGVGVAAVVLVLLGGTTWASDGFWAPDGAYSRFISPIIGLVWITFVSGLLLTRAPSTSGEPQRQAVPAS